MLSLGIISHFIRNYTTIDTLDINLSKTIEHVKNLNNLVQHILEHFFFVFDMIKKLYVKHRLYVVDRSKL